MAGKNSVQNVHGLPSLNLLISCCQTPKSSDGYTVIDLQPSTPLCVLHSRIPPTSFVLWFMQETNGKVSGNRVLYNLQQVVSYVNGATQLDCCSSACLLLIWQRSVRLPQFPVSGIESVSKLGRSSNPRVSQGTCSRGDQFYD